MGPVDTGQRNTLGKDRHPTTAIFDMSAAPSVPHRLDPRHLRPATDRSLLTSLSSLHPGRASHRHGTVESAQRCKEGRDRQEEQKAAEKK